MFAIGEFARHGRVSVRMAPVVVKRVASLRVAQLTGTAAGYEPQFITPVIQALYRELPRLLCNAGVAITGPGVSHYEDTDGATGAIKVHAALPVAEQREARREFDIVHLGEIPAAATLIHRGSMDNVLASIQALARWIDASGYQSLGYARELTLQFGDDPDDWVTELQEPITPK